MKKLIVIDGNSLANRAFYGIPMLSNSKGVITNAVYGFTNMLMGLINNEKPDYLAVAFDKSKKVFRHEQYADYKGQRKGMPEELRSQMPLIKDVLRELNIPIFEQEGYEADDIIGTMVKWAEQQGLHSLIITGDKDSLQLISPQTHVMLTKKGITDLAVYTEETLKAEYGLKPAQIIDLKGLMGDSSDNIPGVPGVGQKTAQKLLEQYGSVEGVYEHLEDFKGKKMGEKLETNKDLAFLSKTLATIFCEVPVELEEEQLRVKPANNEQLLALYKELEFTNLIKNFVAENQEEANESDDSGVRINTPQQLKEALEKEAFDELGILLTYTTNDAQRGEVTAVGLWMNEESYYIPCEQEFSLYAEVLKPYLQKEEILKFTHDAKMLYIFFKRENIEVRGLNWDSVLGAYVINPEQKDLSLESLIYDQLNLTVAKEEPKRTFGLLKGMYDLANKIIDQLEQLELLDIYGKVELPLSRILAEMELQGVKLDRNQLEEMSKDLEIRVNGLTNKIYDLAGEQFNINSPKQLGVILFERLGLPVIKKTKTGYSTDAEVLDTLAQDHEIVKEILEYRQLVKLKSTYVDGLMNLIHPKTGKVHTSFNQTITATGRLSSTEPNLQNIPIRTEDGRKIRKAFVPSKEGYLLLTADYSQIELRILAHMAQDQVLMDSFLKNQDIHTRTASEVFNVPLAEVTKEMRRNAKAVNFGIVYGQSDYGLSKELGITRKEAKEYIDNYFAKYDGVKDWIDETIQSVRTKGYATTLDGRIRYISDINSKNFNLRSFAERTAVNTPIQGTAADLIKKAMIDIQRQLNQNKFATKMILQVHDELVFEVPPHEMARVIVLVKECMENVVSLSVPLKVDMNVGFNWYDLESI